jgi:hypothetical protein
MPHYIPHPFYVCKGDTPPIFRFILDQATNQIAGTAANASVRRRALARNFLHAGIATALSQVKGPNVEPKVAHFFGPVGPVATPQFVRNFASAFIDAKQKRHDADYDLNAGLSEQDALTQIARVEGAIADWKNATNRADKDFKHALCILLLLEGKLRQS